MTAEQFTVWIGGYLALSSTISNRECIIKSALDRLIPLEFCYFLNGFFECSSETMTKAELVMQDHLALVFNKATPDRIENPEFRIVDYKILRNPPLISIY